MRRFLGKLYVQVLIGVFAGAFSLELVQRVISAYLGTVIGDE